MNDPVAVPLSRPISHPIRIATPILMYHSVCDDDVTPASRFVVRRKTFAQQLAWLAAWGYTTSTDVDVGPAASGGRGRTVMLTFDDGYADNHDVVLPLLLQHGFTATIFAVADFTRRRCWWDPEGRSGGALLGPSQMRAMAALGIRFGAHGMTHRRMDALPSSVRRDELGASREALADVLGRPVDAMAWPYGSVDSDCKRDAAEAGYRTAFAVHSGPWVRTDPYEIRRTFMGDRAGPAYMRAKLLGIEAAVRWVAWRLRGSRSSQRDTGGDAPRISERAPDAAPP